MQAFTRTRYGGPEVLQLETVEKPLVPDDHILVRVMANSANPADWHILRGEPFFARFTFGLFKPKDKIIGADFAGIVVEAGSNVTGFAEGDRVFGETLKGGAFAEYVSVPANVCAHIPEGIQFTEIAGVPVAGLTAFQALVTHGKIKAGETILINGASGGVGHLAVQIAKAYGGKVTAVCSAKNKEFVLSIGADHVIAYDKENIHQHQDTYDMVLDTNGNLTFSDFKRMGKRGVLTGFTTIGHMMGVVFKSKFKKYPLAQFTAEAHTKDLKILADLIRDKKIKIAVDRTYSFTEIPAAIAYIEAMRTKGKVIMTGTVEALS